MLNPRRLPLSLLLRQYRTANFSHDLPNLRNRPSKFGRLVAVLGLSHEPANAAWSCRVVSPVTGNPWARSPRSAAELLPSSIPHTGLVVFRDRVDRRRRFHAVFGRAGLRRARDGSAVLRGCCAGLQPFQQSGLMLGCFERIVSHVGKLAELRQGVGSLFCRCFCPARSPLYSSAATQIFVPVSNDNAASVHPGDRHCCGVGDVDMVAGVDMSSDALSDSCESGVRMLTSLQVPMKLEMLI